MASKSRIQGITIELDGEVTGLEKALKDVTSKSIDLQGELRDVDRLLKFDPGNVEALAQKQDILNRQIENTTEKLNSLKNAQEEVEKQFQSGDIGEKQYRAFKREVEYTEKSLDNFKTKLKEIDGSQVKELKTDFNKVGKSVEESKDEIKEAGNELVNLAAGAAAVVGVGEVLEKALDVSGLNTKIEVSFDVPEASLKSVKDAISTVSAYGVDAEEALEGVRRQWSLNKDVSDETNQAIITGAATISASYSGIDFTELIQETNEMSSSLNISNEEALGMINSLLKIGFPPEQLDIITEYGSQLFRAGYNAEEIQGIMAAGVETGSWNIDVLLDGLKEGRIKLTEFGQGVDEATANLFSQIGISQEQLVSWGKAVSEGGEAGKLAMQEVSQALAGVEDKTLQNQIGTTVFGTLWEENGTKITDTILGMNDNLVTSKENQDALNESTNALDSDPAIRMKEAMSELNVALEPILSLIAEIIGKVADWIKENPTLTATITAIVAVLGILLGLFLAISPIITALTALAGTLGISIGAIAAPVLAVIGVITTLIAIGVALYKNWDEIKAKCISTWRNIENFFKGINLYDIGSNIIKGLINGVKSMASSLISSVKGVVSGAIEGAKNLLGIHSPSRVFMEFGEYTGEGFINGINQMKDSVAKAGQNMADASIPDIDIPKPNPNAPKAGGIKQTINIYSPKALSPSETARQNKKVLQNLALNM